jgi:hypothetical protein
MKKLMKNRINTLKRKVSAVKYTALLRLFGIKSRNNSLHFSRIEVKERDYTPDEFNEWAQTMLK